MCREFDDETGLNYHRARYLDSFTGNWLNEDPIGFAAGDTNLNRYVNNSPLDATDPSGLQEYSNFAADLARQINNAGRQTGSGTPHYTNPATGMQHW